MILTMHAATDVQLPASWAVTTATELSHRVSFDLPEPIL